MADLVADRSILVCCGPGGVGKTTVAAALAVEAARTGRRAVVVTIDPARRLADALGLEELGNEPRRVDAAVLEAHGIEMRGELWAMMLDPKATFDGLIAALAPDAATRDDVLGNRIYAQLSSAIAGSQEFSAVARLYELHTGGGYDAIVLDTPPSRNALDFLDAPDRLTDFFGGRALKLFLVPTGIAGRLMGAGTSVVFGILRKLTGVNLLDDVSVLFRSMGSLIDGFRERASAVKALLRDDATTFLIVTSPEREPVAEAIFFRQKLREAGMRFGGLIVNRAAVLTDAEMTDPATIRAELAGELGDALAAKVAAGSEDLQILALRHAEAIARLKAELEEPEPIIVPRLDGEVQDIDGLLVLYRHLAG
jgi:anion-transporting  ArsA/GET3 family ATPase